MLAGESKTCREGASRLLLHLRGLPEGLHGGGVREGRTVPGLDVHVARRGVHRRRPLSRPWPAGSSRALSC